MPLSLKEIVNKDVEKAHKAFKEIRKKMTIDELDQIFNKILSNAGKEKKTVRERRCLEFYLELAINQVYRLLPQSNASNELQKEVFDNNFPQDQQILKLTQFLFDIEKSSSSEYNKAKEILDIIFYDLFSGDDPDPNSHWEERLTNPETREKALNQFLNALSSTLFSIGPAADDSDASIDSKNGDLISKKFFGVRANFFDDTEDEEDEDEEFDNSHPRKQ